MGAPAPLLALLLLGPAAAVVDDNGRYRSGVDLTSLAPPPPTEEERAASMDLSQAPPEKLFRLLAYEMLMEEKRPPERRLGLREFQMATELTCEESVIALANEAALVEEDMRVFQLNITGTSGLFWLLHQYPEEHSWTWLIGMAADRAQRKVMNHLARLAMFAFSDARNCLSPGFRTVLMTAASTWKKLHADHIALLWNGVAFGVLGDVTSWREIDEEGAEEEGPGGPPPNVSWSENLIFGNMFLSSLEKWLEHQAGELAEAARTELAHLQHRIPLASEEQRWRKSTNGVLSPFEQLRRQVFQLWELDKGVLRGMLRYCLQVDYTDRARPSVADFGAGAGRYSQWLNETGLVDAFAMDASLSVRDITGGAVEQVDLAKEVHLWRTFDWALCLEVGGYIPLQDAKAMLQNIRRHAKRGLVMSWPSEHAEAKLESPLPEADFVALVQQETGFTLDRALTETLRAGSELEHVAKTVAVFRAPAS